MRAAEIAGVTAVGLSGSLPPDNGGDVNNFDLLDKPVPTGASQPVAPWSAVTPGYFTALGIPLLEGRLLSLADSGASPPVVVVSRAWARKYYAGTSAIGKELRSGGCTTCPPTTVVGVVGDVPYLGLATEAEGVYAPLAQEGGRSLHLVVRSLLGPAATFRALRSAVASLDPDLAPVEVDMTDHLRRALGDPRRSTTVVGAFAAAGVLLAALGVFGLMSYVVRQRRREMGVRLALGASPRALTRLVVERGMRHALLGTLIGLGLSAFASRWLGSLLFGVAATDPDHPRGRGGPPAGRGGRRLLGAGTPGGEAQAARGPVVGLGRSYACCERCSGFRNRNSRTSTVRDKRNERAEPKGMSRATANWLCTRLPM